MDSNFRFRVRCQRFLRRKSPLRLHAAVDHLRLPSVAISSGAKRNLGTEPLSRAEPEVRIHLPPAASQRRTRSKLIMDYMPASGSSSLLTKPTLWSDAPEPMMRLSVYL